MNDLEKAQKIQPSHLKITATGLYLQKFIPGTVCQLSTT